MNYPFKSQKNRGRQHEITGKDELTQMNATNHNSKRCWVHLDAKKNCTSYMQLYETYIWVQQQPRQKKGSKDILNGHAQNVAS